MWNPNATPDFLPEQHSINELLSRMTPADREVVAEMLRDEFESGVFESLNVLERFGVPPFEDGYEGSPFHDFIGRLGDWNWPESASGNE